MYHNYILNQEFYKSFQTPHYSPNNKFFKISIQNKTPKMKDKNHEKQYFDKIYKDYLKDISVKLNYAFIKNIILKSKKTGNVLELGCAYGYFLKTLGDNFQTFGVDISEYALGQGAKLSPNSKFFKADLETTNLADFLPKMDFIVASNTLEHITKPEKIIKEANILLNKGGYLIFRVPNPSCIYFKLLNKNDFDCKIIGIPPTNFIKKLMYKLDIFLTFKPFYLLNHSVILQCKR